MMFFYDNNYNRAIRCDECKASTTERLTEWKAGFIKRLRANGWSIGKYHKCPNCRNPQKQIIYFE